jgi:hypothetical protein
MHMPVINRDIATSIYLAEAAVSGAVIGWPNMDSVILWGTVIVGGVGATLYRKRVLHEKSWSRSEIEWLVTFGTVWVGVQLSFSSGLFA